jgi:hypothetical protein
MTRLGDWIATVVLTLCFCLRELSMTNTVTSRIVLALEQGPILALQAPYDDDEWQDYEW